MDIQEKNDILSFDDADGFDYKEFVGKIINKWYLFLASIIICLSGSFLYLKLATPQFVISSKLLVEDQKNNSGGALSNNMISDFSSLFDLPSNAQNEIEILKSRSLMEKVVEQMNLNATLYKAGRFRLEELFLNAPVTLKTIYKTDSVTDVLFDVQIKGNAILVINNETGTIVQTAFKDTVKFPEYNLVFEHTGLENPTGDYKLSIVSVDRKVESMIKNLDAQLSDKQSTTIDLTLNYALRKKGEVILQSLMDNYLKTNLEYKVETADSTIAFINRRLLIVQKELTNVEKDFSGFKSENSLANPDEQSKALVTSASDYYNQLNTQEIQLAVVNDLEKYISDPANKTIIPSSLTDQDPVFADAITKYNELLLERDKLNLSYKDTNPIVISLDNQIQNVKSNLLKSFEAYKKGLQTSKNELKSRNGSISNQIKSAPEKERVFLDYSRQQNLKQELYLYLLQKKEETMISKTSTISSARIIDNARSNQAPFKPKHSLVYLIGLAVGLIAPVSYLAIKDGLSVKIVSKQDIEKNTKVPVVAEIGNNGEKNNVIMFNNSRSVISEQFRSLRTNLQFLVKQSVSQVIMITSNVSGEGKTFISVNLAASLAISGKKVICLELDLRKPKLSAALDQDHNNGFTNFIVSENDDVTSFIKPTLQHPNLYLLSSGPTPPNPSEILLSERFSLLINQLKNEFDFIVIDSAPVGLVSDALTISNSSDLNLYVLRQNYSLKHSLTNLNSLIKGEKLKRTYIVVNDIQASSGGYYGYSNYGYGYGYGYGDYGQENKKTFFARMTSFFKN